MDIGIPKENGTTNLERRAILLPKEVSKLVEAGHNVFVVCITHSDQAIAFDDHARSARAHIGPPGDLRTGVRPFCLPFRFIR